MKIADVSQDDFLNWLKDPITLAFIETIKAEYYDLLRTSAMAVSKNKIEDARVSAGRIAEIEDILTMFRVSKNDQIPDPFAMIEGLETEVLNTVDPALEA